MSEETLDLGRPVPTGRLDATISEVLVPAALGSPDAAYVSAETYGRRLTLVYEPGDGVPESPYSGVGILVSEFVGESDPGFIDKLVAAGATVERVQVGDYPALWIEGGPHVVLFHGDDGRVFEDQAASQATRSWWSATNCSCASRARSTGLARSRSPNPSSSGYAASAVPAWSASIRAPISRASSTNARAAGER